MNAIKARKLVANGKNCVRHHCFLHCNLGLLLKSIIWEQAKLFICRAHGTNLLSIASALQECFPENTVANKGNGFDGTHAPLNFIQSNVVLDVPSTALVGDWVRLRQACPHQNPLLFQTSCWHAPSFHSRQIRCSESWIGNHHRPILVAPPNKSTTCHAYRTATWIFFQCEKSGRQPQWCKHFGLEGSPEGQTCTYNTEVRSDNMDPEDDPWKFTLLKPNIGASSRCRKKYEGSTKPTEPCNDTMVSVECPHPLSRKCSQQQIKKEACHTETRMNLCGSHTHTHTRK